MPPPLRADAYRSNRSVNQAIGALSSFYWFDIEMAEDDTPAPAALKGALLVHVMEARRIPLSGTGLRVSMSGYGCNGCVQ